MEGSRFWWEMPCYHMVRGTISKSGFAEVDGFQGKCIILLSLYSAFDFVMKVVQRIWSLYAPKFVTEHPLHHTVFQ
jgi:hypothetical protein